MAILGNISLTIATLIFFILVSSVFGKAPPQTGDAVMGYPLGIILFNLVFLACMILAAIAIAGKGGFDWVSPDKTTRNVLVAACLLSTVGTAALSALFKYERVGVPVILKVFSGFAPFLIPLVLLAAGFVLLNATLRESVPVLWYKWPLMVIFGIGVVGIGAAVFSWISASNANTAAQLESIAADQARYHQGHLDEISSCDVTKKMSSILVFTDANHDSDVREAAIAMIKTNPHWQEELIRLLENKGAIEAFYFLASEEVDDKTLFVKPVNTGLLSIANWIERNISEASHPSHLYPDLFLSDVKRALQTAEKFEGMGQDYLPAVHKIRAALDTPATVEKPRFDCAAVLDRWIIKHK